MPQLSDQAISREGWGSRLGFMLASVGSAVGLGNMWRFPYATSEHGGAAFVFLYIVMVFAMGIPLMGCEFVVGRHTKLSPVGALRTLGGRHWAIVGHLFVLVGFCILAYYSVITGWTLRYAIEALTIGLPADPAAHFDQVATGHDALAFHLLSMTVMIAVVAGGVRSGIERTSFILMPALFILIIGLAIWAFTLDGAAAGYSFYLKTDFGKLFSLKVLVAAAGQAFFSLSLGMGAMLTYASYLSRKENLPVAAVTISTADFLVAFIAGLVVFPIIFAFDLSGEISESTLGALFIGLPKAFAAMGNAGRFVAFMFFATLLVGALTSGISLLEVVTASAMDGKHHAARKKAALFMGAIIALVGAPCAYDLEILAIFDQVVGNVLLASGALALAFLVGWKMKNPTEEIAHGFEGPSWMLKGWHLTLRFVVPPVLILVLYQSIQDTWVVVGGMLSN
ncbi:MAG: sodium-dependent transporter [Myxococcales bacterium]|nr:MAG: sodium-dependent transporter [Myxococcales bacterium]